MHSVQRQKRNARLRKRRANNLESSHNRIGQSNRRRPSVDGHRQLASNHEYRPSARRSHRPLRTPHLNLIDRRSPRRHGVRSQPSMGRLKQLENRRRLRSLAERNLRPDLSRGRPSPYRDHKSARRNPNPRRVRPSRLRNSTEQSRLRNRRRRRRNSAGEAGRRAARSAPFEVDLHEFRFRRTQVFYRRPQQAAGQLGEVHQPFDQWKHSPHRPAVQ